MKNINNYKFREKKKKGFTLVEVIAVICIICIIAAVMLPKFTGYITKAKKFVVVSQCRKVVMAVDFYNVEKAGTKVDEKVVTPISDNVEVSTITDKISEYISSNNEVDKLGDKITVEKCRNIVQGEDFEIGEDGSYSSGSKTS